MVQLRTMLVPADNSGAKRLQIIGVPGELVKLQLWETLFFA